MKKRIMAVLLACMALVSVTACTSTPSSDETNSTTTQTEPKKEEKSAYAVGETWVVDGQWEFTINSVTATDERNQFSDKNPAAVYVIDYTYKNTGYVDNTGIMDGLYISLDMDANVVDNSGVMGYSYPWNIDKDAQQTPVDATCNAQQAVGVDNVGDFTLNISKYDGNSKKQTAKFNITVQ